MKAAIIYKSVSGNTKLLAEAIREVLKEQVVYFGEPDDDIKADIYFIGSWTDKGKCCAEIESYIKTLNDKKIAYFGTAGFGGSEEYYHALFERVQSIAAPSNEMKEYFFCQGKMPMHVRDRYVSMMKEYPEDKKLEVSIQNFDNALHHPDEEDLKAVQNWAVHVCK